MRAAHLGSSLLNRRGVYSIAMLVTNTLSIPGRRDVQIFATDIDQAALEVARAGVYPESIISDVSRSV